MLSGEREKKYDTNDTSNNRVTHICHDTFKYNDNTCIVEKSRWKISPQLIISAVTPKLHDGIPTEELTSAIAYEPNY